MVKDIKDSINEPEVKHERCSSSIQGMRIGRDITDCIERLSSSIQSRRMGMDIKE